jgi:methionyl-tRNA formyltransferase
VKFALAGTLDYFLATLRHLVGVGRPPALVILPAEPNIEPYRRVAHELGIEVWLLDDMNASADRIAAAGLDLLVSVGWPRLMKKRVLEAPRLGCINLHTSKLPDYRGRHPVHWAMLRGEREVGVTLHFMNERFDAGDIILQDTVPIERDDDLNDVHHRLAPVGARLVERGLAELEAGLARAQRQDPKAGRYFPRRTPEDGVVDWTRPGFEVARLVNTLVDPLPNAFTYHEGKVVKLKRAFPGKQPGEVVAKTTDGRYVIATGDGVVLVEADQELEVGSVTTPISSARDLG